MCLPLMTVYIIHFPRARPGLGCDPSGVMMMSDIRSAEEFIVSQFTQINKMLSCLKIPSLRGELGEIEEMDITISEQYLYVDTQTRLPENI